MKSFLRLTLLVVMLLQNATIMSHGFAKDTLVGLESSNELLSIEVISQRFFRGQKTKVCTYKEKTKKWKTKPVQAAAYCESNVFIELKVSKNYVSLAESINCSPLQLFYRLSDKEWIPAHELREGDLLLCEDNAITWLQSKTQVSSSKTLYIIEVKTHHTFVVGHQKILTHNLFIPVATTIGMAIPFDLVLHAGAWGCMFGPVTFCCSIAVAGVAAAVACNYSKEKQTEFSLVFDDARGWNFTTQYNDAASNINDAQAPGQPTENDGFIPKKKWDGKKIKHSVTGQVGWPDEKDNVWKPTGLGSSAHGGPHWDVISKDGKRHWNIMPGGKERGSK